MAVASTYNKPFLLLSAGERRNLIEVIFNIYVLASMLNEVKRRNKMNQTQQQLNIATMTGLNEQQVIANRFVNETQQIIDKFELNKSNNIARLNSEISDCENTIERCNKNIAIADKKMKSMENKLDDNTTLQDLTQLQTEISIANRNIKELTETLITLTDNAKCPICGSNLTDEHAKTHIKELQDKLSKQQTIANQNDKVNELKAVLADIRKNKQLYDTIVMKRTEQVNLLNNAKSNITNLTAEKTKQENSNCDINVEQYKEQLKTLSERIVGLSNEMSTLDNKIKLDCVLVDILGDDGLKTYFFKQLLPQLNSQVNKYITAFGLQITLEFDQNLDVVIQQGKYECEYMGFSAGERARIDMAILLAFFDISRNISNWSCNTLFIDEVMDGGVDANGVEQFISTLFNVVSSSTQNDLGVYLISHKLGNIDVAWDSVVEITKTNRFSELKVTNNHEDSAN